MIKKTLLACICTSWICILLFVSLQYVYSNSLAQDGRKATDLEQNIQKVGYENALLLTQVVRMQSLSSIEEKAKTLGFVVPSAYETIRISEPQVALR